LIAQNVHGSKLFKFEVSGQLHGKQWDNLTLTSLNSNHKCDRVNRYSLFKRIIPLFFYFWRVLMSWFFPYFKFWENVNPSGKIHDIYEWLQSTLNLWL
jgi:hypothetical protein